MKAKAVDVNIIKLQNLAWSIMKMLFWHGMLQEILLNN